MKLPIKLRKPQEIIWLLAVVLLIAGVVMFYTTVPVPGVSAFWIPFVAALLMILGTWLF